MTGTLAESIKNNHMRRFILKKAALACGRHDSCNDAGIYAARIFISVDLYRSIFIFSNHADGCK